MFGQILIGRQRDQQQYFVVVDEPVQLPGVVIQRHRAERPAPLLNERVARTFEPRGRRRQPRLVRLPQRLGIVHLFFGDDLSLIMQGAEPFVFFRRCHELGFGYLLVGPRGLILAAKIEQRLYVQHLPVSPPLRRVTLRCERVCDDAGIPLFFFRESQYGPALDDAQARRAFVMVERRALGRR